MSGELYFAKRYLGWVLPDGQGLTGDIQFAGLFTEAEAEELKKREGTTVRPARELLGMLNARREESVATTGRIDQLIARARGYGGGHPHGGLTSDGEWP